MARRQEVEALRRQLAEVNATAKQLQNIKDEFNHDVHSVRRLENVNSVADFLRLLDRRDLLNEQALQRVSRIVDFVSEAPSEGICFSNKTFLFCLVVACNHYAMNAL